MSEDHQLGAVGCREVAERDLAESGTTVAGPHVRAAGLRAPRGEPARHIRREPPKRADGERVAKHRPQRAVAPVLGRAQAIAVLDSRAPSGDLAVPGADVVRDADVIPEYRTAPAVVVAGDPEDLRTGLAQRREGRQHAKGRAGNYRSPLIPELEQVAVDDERRRLAVPGLFAPPIEKVQERAIHRRRRKANVGVREDVAECTGHARILAHFAVWGVPD